MATPYANPAAPACDHTLGPSAIVMAAARAGTAISAVCDNSKTRHVSVGRAEQTFERHLVTSDVVTNRSRVRYELEDVAAKTGSAQEL